MCVTSAVQDFKRQGEMKRLLSTLMSPLVTTAIVRDFKVLFFQQGVSLGSVTEVTLALLKGASSASLVNAERQTVAEVRCSHAHAREGLELRCVYTKS